MWTFATTGALGVLCAIAIAGTYSPSAAGPQPLDAAATFDARVNAYLVVRYAAREAVAPEHIIDPRIRKISGALLAARLREARSSARPGDVFSPPLSDVIRYRLSRIYDGTDVDVLFRDLYPDGPPPDRSAQVNATYPPRVAVAPPVALLSALFPVPFELGYRLIGRDLVLWDEEACQVIDVVADALPAPQAWRFLAASSTELRQRVDEALRASGLHARLLLEEMASDGEPAGWRAIVGERFCWTAGHLMPASVLLALPPLPGRLEYRFVGPDLVVVDVQTEIVAGVLFDVLAPRRAPALRVTRLQSASSGHDLAGATE